MMKHFYIIPGMLFLLPFTGCQDYLDTVPKNDIETIETIFEQKEQAQNWLWTCHWFIKDDLTSFGLNPAYTGTDEIVANDYVRKIDIGTDRRKANGGYEDHKICGLYIGDGLQMAQDPYGDVWKKDRFYAGIRYCNTFLENINSTYNMEDSERRLWIAEVKALKAHFYFELMRRYGPIILVPQNIDVNSTMDVMQQPRSPIDTCVQAIVDLVDEAIDDLPAMNQKDPSRVTFHNKESAATLKAYALLYAASPIFNGNPFYADFTNKDGVKLFNSEVDKNKWKRAAEAIDEAVKICELNGKKLIADAAGQETDLLKTMMNIENSSLADAYKSDEAILFLKGRSIWPTYTLPYVKSTELEFYCSYTNGSVAPSMKMVEMFYTDHGLPIDADASWDYSSRYQLGKESNPLYRNVVPLEQNIVLGLHLRREPRFYADIAADRTYWQRGPIIKDNMIVKAYKDELYGTQLNILNSSVPQNRTGYWMKKGTFSTVPNKTYYSVLNQESPFIVFRLAELYLMQAEAWNEYLDQPDSRVYDPLNKVRERAGIPDVETAWSNYSKTPDKVRTQVGMREIIQREWDIEFAFEGRRFWNLRRWLLAADVLNDKLYGWNVLGKTPEQFYNHFEGPVVVWTKRKFMAPRDYLFPIRSEEVLISGCKQNPGW